MRVNSMLNLSLTLLSLITPTLARQTSTSYCKCICFQNSTIIPLNSPQKPPGSSPPPPSLLFTPKGRRDDEAEEEGGDSGNGDGRQNSHHRSLTCSDCNRAFCLDYHLPICKDAKEEDVFTSCFQRDSLKDETVVLLFIFLTASLLSWAVLKPWIDKVRDGGSIASYAPIFQSADRGAGSMLPRTENAYRNADTDITRRRGGSDTGSVARQGGLNS